MLYQKALLILFFINSFIIGGETYNKERLSIAHSGFSEGLKELNKGNMQEAQHILLGAYYRAKKHDPQLSSIKPQILSTIYNAIIQTQLASPHLSLRHIDRAIDFAHKTRSLNPEAITTTATIIMQKAAEAEENNNILFATECHKKAFTLFEKESTTNDVAKETYENLLFRGIGWDFNLPKVVDYFFTQLKRNSSIYTMFTQNTAQKRDYILQKLDELALQGSMRAQCILTKGYINGEYGMPISHTRALHYCQRYLLKLATLSSLIPLPTEYFIIPLTLKKLSFKDKTAATLNAYYNFLHACYTNNQTIIKKFCNAPKTSLRPLIMKMLSANHHDSDKYLKKIKKLKPTNPKVKAFCESDGFIALPLLKQQLENLTDKTDGLGNALNYFLGICAYQQYDYQQTEQHFKQCNLYSNDLLTQCLLLHSYHHLMDFASLEDIAHNITRLSTVLRLLMTSTLCEKPTPRDIYATDMLSHTLTLFYAQYIPALLAEKEYQTCYELVRCASVLPTTSTAACEALLMIEQILAQEPDSYKTEVYKSPERKMAYRTLEEIAKQKNHNPHTCLSLSNLFTQQMEEFSDNYAVAIPLHKKALALLECASRHTTIYTEQDIIRIRADAAQRAYYIGGIEQSLEFLDKAIALGNSEAYYNKAMLLLQQAGPKDKELIYSLLKKNIDAEAMNCSDAYNELAGQLRLERNVKKQKITFTCLLNAAARNNYKRSLWLADLYIDGIKENDTYFLEPNTDKALYYLTKQIDSMDTIYIGQALMKRGNIYYCEGKLQEAYEDFKSAQKCIIPLERQIECIWFAGLAKMCLTADQKKIKGIKQFKYVRDALLEMDVHYSELNIDPTKRPLVSLFIDENIYNVGHAITSAILEAKDTSPDALELCHAMGRVFYRAAFHKPITDEKRMHGLRCLRYAAQNGLFISQWALAHADMQDVNSLESIYYLEMALKQAPEAIVGTKKYITDALAKMYPTTIKDQACLIQYYTENNQEEFLTKYLSQLYESVTPFAPAKNEDKIKPLIQFCFSNPFLTTAANNFIKNPFKSTPLEHYTAIFLGSLYAYSQDPQLLIAGARYLDTAYNSFPMLRLEVQKKLGYTYYKLGLIHTESPMNNPSMAQLYLEKGTEFNDINAMTRLIRLWLEDNSKELSVNPEKIIALAEFAHAIVNDVYTKALLLQCRAKYKKIDKEKLLLEKAKISQNVFSKNIIITKTACLQ